MNVVKFMIVFSIALLYRLVKTNLKKAHPIPASVSASGTKNRTMRILPYLDFSARVVWK